GARERAVAIRLRGIGHQLKKEFPAAIESFREALDLLRSLSAESRDLSSGLNTLGGAEFLSGDWKSAERHYREALHIARAVKFDQGIAQTICNLAAVAASRKNWTQAENLARE